MKLFYRPIIIAFIVISVVGFSAICWHSVEEIHYLKSFFPKSFTVEEAFYASLIELIKIVILGVPFFLVIGLGVLLIRGLPSQKGNDPCS